MELELPAARAWHRYWQPAVEGQWPLLNPEATTTELSINQDRAYLRNIPIEELP